MVGKNAAGFHGRENGTRNGLNPEEYIGKWAEVGTSWGLSTYGVVNYFDGHSIITLNPHMRTEISEGGIKNYLIVEGKLPRIITSAGGLDVQLISKEDVLKEIRGYNKLRSENEAKESSN